MTSSRVLVSLGLTLLSAGSAQAFVLSGHAYCSGEPMDGATIAATSNSTGITTGPVSTDSDGAYQLDLTYDTYTVTVVPPAGSQCAQQAIEGKQVHADEAYEILLISPSEPPPEPTTYHLEGTITAGDGVPVSQVQVDIDSNDGSGYGSARTDADGHWSADVKPGTKQITYNLNNYDDLNPVVPQRFNCRYQDVVVNADLVIDHDYPFVLVSGHLTGASSGDPKPQVSISESSSITGCNSYDYTSTDDDGAYSTWAFASSHSSVTSEAVVGQLQSTTGESDTPASGAVTIDLVALEIVTVPVTGRFLGFEGAPISNIGIRLRDPHGQYLYVYADAEGDIAFSAEPGTYEYEFEGNHNDDQSGAEIVPQQLDCHGTLELGTDSFIDFALPVALVDGNVHGATNGAPVANVYVIGYGPNEFTFGTCYQDRFTTYTDDDGYFGPHAILAGGTVRVSADSLAGQFDSSSASQTLDADATATFVLLAPELETFPIDGAITGYAGNLVPNASDTFYGPQYFDAEADENGHYSIDLIEGDFRRRVSGGSDDPTIAPPNFSCEYDTYVHFADAATSDFALDFKRVRGRITNAAGIPIEDVRIRVQTYGSQGDPSCDMYFNVDTDADGRYDFAVASGNVRFSYEPPYGSGYVSSTVISNVATDLNQQVILQLPDIVPPVITTGPLVIHHSDTSVSVQWTTNEVTDATLEYQQGTTISVPIVLTSSTSSTNHLFTLTDLDSQTTYAFRVSGKDGGNNTVTSTTDTFVTTRDPDTTPPTITGGPTAIYVSPILVRVFWTTNEPASSVVTVSTPGEADRTVTNAAFVLDHDVVVTGLTPGTLYTVTVSSTDPDLNPSAAVDPLAVRTPAVLDQTAPVISNLRSECITATVMSICWDTNEASTSAVGYIDQNTSAAASVSSSALVTAHCLALTNLSPSTSYTIAVSSTDGGANTGNGGPITRTTLSAAAGGEPVISQLFAAAVGTTGARVTWQTDRPSSTLVQYGPSETDTPSTAGNLSASETSHTVILSGLYAPTTYVRVVSTNQCGQSTTSTSVPVVDVDECTTGTAGCDVNADCHHSVGQTSCTCQAGFSGNGTHCCADCTGGRERATDCGGVATFGCDFRPTFQAQTLDVFAGSAVNTVVGNVVGTDQDMSDALTYSILAGNGGAFTLSSSGVLRVANAAVVDAAVNGNIVLTIRVIDALGLSSSGTLTVRVAPKPGPCHDNPCVHGACVENGDVAICSCTNSGYSGPLCATDVDECLTANGGCADTCTNDPGSYHCGCTSGTLAADGTSCLAAGECASHASCDEVAQDLVFFGVVGDDNGEPVGSIKCVRAASGGVTCDNEDGELVVSPVLWCAP